MSSCPAGGPQQRIQPEPHGIQHVSICRPQNAVDSGLIRRFEPPGQRIMADAEEAVFTDRRRPEGRVTA
jgi:hypothetical protein